MRTLTFLLICSSGCSICMSQSTEQNDIRLLDGTHFAFKLSNGFNTTQAFHDVGESKLSGGLVHQHAFNLEVFKYLGKGGLFVGLNGGFGINGYVYKTDADIGYSGSEYYSYYNKLDAFPYIHGHVGFGHARMLNSRWTLRNHLNFGIRSGSSFLLKSGHSNTEGKVLSYSIESNGNSRPLLRLESDIGYKLRNNDILELGLFYTYTNTLVYQGEYVYFKDPSTGSFQNYGREFGITLNYIFTGYDKRLVRNSAQSDGADKFSDLIRLRKERRTFQPGSWLIGPRVGLHGARFKVDENSALFSGSSLATHVGVNFNYNRSEKDFWEGDLSINHYHEVTISRYGKSVSSSSGDFILTLSAGRGYRVLGKNNYNWINISAGVSANYLGSQTGFQGTSRTRISRQGLTLLDAQSETRISHRFYPGVYLTLSKDFLIGRNSYISLAFRHTEGFYPVIQREVETSGSDVTGGMEMFQSNFSGSSNTFSIGFKRRFGN